MLWFQGADHPSFLGGIQASLPWRQKDLPLLKTGNEMCVWSDTERFDFKTSDLLGTCRKGANTGLKSPSAGRHRTAWWHVNTTTESPEHTNRAQQPSFVRTSCDLACKPTTLEFSHALRLSGRSLCQMLRKSLQTDPLLTNCQPRRNDAGMSKAEEFELKKHRFLPVFRTCLKAFTYNFLKCIQWRTW